MNDGPPGIAPRVVVTVLVAATLAAFWVFSRFTVDDAFISWRYGKNLVEAGVWNYNPARFDMTQAYSNPVFAALGVIPNALGLDVVLFFKLFSALTLALFATWFSRKSGRSWGWLLLFLCLPATMLHAFGGLETFLFVALMTALLIALDEGRETLSLVLTLALFATRPEAWALLILVPLYFLFQEPGPAATPNGKRPTSGQFVQGIRLSWADGGVALLALGLPLAIHFALHLHHFGSALPNTVYVKTGNRFDVRAFGGYCFYIAPLLALLAVGRIKLLLTALAMFGAMAVSYSASDLMMDHGARFAFHVFAPVYLFLIYLAWKERAGRLSLPGRDDGRAPWSVRTDVAIKAVLLVAWGVFALQSAESVRMLAHLVTYYPRALDAHAELGKTLKRMATERPIRAFALGDAGMAAYHSGLVALDNIGLGSSAVARHGLDGELLDRYGVDLIAFHASPGGIRLEEFHQQTMADWALASGLVEICDVYWTAGYTLRVFARNDSASLRKVCETSRAANIRNNWEYIGRTIAVPPWRYWRE